MVTYRRWRPGSGSNPGYEDSPGEQRASEVEVVKQDSVGQGVDRLQEPGACGALGKVDHGSTEERSLGPPLEE
jgi:hypothetical protein